MAKPPQLKKCLESPSYFNIFNTQGNIV